MPDSEQRCRVRSIVLALFLSSFTSMLFEKLFLLSPNLDSFRAKRYERLMKFHGIHQPASAAREPLKPADHKEEKSSAPTTPVKRTAEDSTQSHPSSSKKSRKSKKGIDDESYNIAMDDDEGLAPAGAAKIKTEKRSGPVVKEEPEMGYHGTTGFQYHLAAEGAGTDGQECGDVLSDFLQPEDFERHSEPDGNTFDGYGL